MKRFVLHSVFLFWWALFPFPSAAGDPAEIPLEAFAQLPRVEMISLSPRGDFLAMVYPSDLGTQYMVFDIRKEPTEPPAPFLPLTPNLSEIWWANEKRLVVAKSGIAIIIGDFILWSGYELVAVDRDGTNSLTVFGGNDRRKVNSWVSILHGLPDDSDHILIKFIPEKAKTPGVYKLNVFDGTTEEIIAPRREIYDWVADDQGIVRLGVGSSGDDVLITVREDAASQWIDLRDNAIFQELQFEILGFGFEPDTLFLRSSLNTGRGSIYEFSFKEGVITQKVFDHPVYDVDGLLVNYAQKKALAALYTADYPEIATLDPNFDKWSELISRVLGDVRFEWIDATHDHKIVILRSYTDSDPGTLYIFDRPNNELSPIWEVLPGLDPELMSPVRKIVYYARDGLEIEAYLTMPKDSDGRNLPTVILPHGGPWARDDMSFNPEVQFLASRGYAVFQPNFRGSSGYGTQFLALGFGEWGNKMQTDLEDGLEWLIREGYTDPTRVCIMGGSYGGYAALRALTKNPGAYKCGIAYAAISDLNLILKNVKGNSDEKFIRAAIAETMGKRELKKFSPVNLAKNIHAPILIMHGKYDRIVPIEHSEKMAKALKKAKKDYSFIILEESGHELVNESERVKYFQEIETFLAKHLKTKESAATNVNMP